MSVDQTVLTGLPTGPQGNSVIEGRRTAEVRWILPGQLDTAVAGWFGRFPAGMDSREDGYLIHPVLRVLRMSRFRLVSGRLTADVRERATESACTADLTEVRPGVRPDGRWVSRRPVRPPCSAARCRAPSR
jgi:hypothetical protein